MASPQVKTIQYTSTSTSTSTKSTPSTSTSTSKPARIQISHSKLKQLRDSSESNNQPGGGTYNIWYNKFSGGDTQQDSNKNLIKADTRCHLFKDQGWTKASRRNTSSTNSGGNSGNYCCLFFARGHCPNGPDCTFLHTLPPPNLLPSLSTDIFGRSKHGDYRDDMGGVGSLQRVNRTLYVGRISEEPRVSSGGGGYNSPGGGGGGVAQWRDGGRTTKGGGNVNDLKKRGNKGKDKVEMDPTELVVRKHFEEWGEIEKVRVLTGKSCAFVTYKTEASAQFAKEAMTCQSLDHNEILNVRWSTQDPNPGAIKREREEMIRIGQKKIEENLTEEMKEAGMLLNQLENQNQDGDQDGEVEEEGEGGGQRKRLKFNGNEEEVEDEELKKLIEENKRGWKEIEREEDERLELERKLEEEKERKRIVMNSGGLLSNDALIGLQSLGSIRRNNEKEKEKAEIKNGGNGNGLMALNGYGSESEDEED